MFHEMIQPLIVQYGIFAVFFIIMFESAGVPLPGETALLAAAIYAGNTGYLNIHVVVAAAVAAAIIGDNIGFMFGRKFGLPLVERYGRHVGLDEKRLAFGQHLFHRHGAKIVFFGRFIAVLRIFAAMLAGVNRFDWKSFLFYNAAGGMCWAALFGYGGFLFGRIIMDVAGPVGVLGLVAAFAGLFGGWWLMRKKEREFEERAWAEMHAAEQEQKAS
jgi:membrane protein DedA with SNARE-associated domain